MATLASMVRTAVEYLLVPFDALPAFWSLTLFSIASGVLMLWVVGKVTPQARIERARDRIAAAIYEMRLFLDSPRRIVAAQSHMFHGLFLYLLFLTPAFVVLTLPLGLLYVHLEVRHGLDALPAPGAHVVRVDLADATDGRGVTASADDGLAVTAPPLFDAGEHRVYLRVRIEAPGDHTLTLRAAHTEVTKRLSAGADASVVSPERQSGVAAWWSYGPEPPLDGDVFRAISVAYPDRPQSWLGLPVPWWLYWLVVATAAALLLRRPMGVVL